MRLARKAGLVPKGVCFHVGSQSLTTEAYEEALLLCRRLFDEAAEEGMPLSMLDIGGGFPIPMPGRKQPDTGAIHLLLKNIDPNWRNDDATTLELKKRQTEIAEKKADAAEW